VNAYAFSAFLQEERAVWKDAVTLASYFPWHSNMTPPVGALERLTSERFTLEADMMG